MNRIILNNGCFQNATNEATTEPKKPERKGPINTGRELGVGSTISNFNKQPQSPTEAPRKEPILLPKETVPRAPVVAPQPDVIPTNVVVAEQPKEPEPEPEPEPIQVPTARSQPVPQPEPVVEEVVQQKQAFVEPEPVVEPEPEPAVVAAPAAAEPEEPEEFILSADNPGVQAIALYDYQAAADDEISFDPDDRITHIEMVRNYQSLKILKTNIPSRSSRSTKVGGEVCATTSTVCFQPITCS